MIKEVLKIIIELFWHRIYKRWQVFFRFCVVGTIGAINDIGGLYILVEFVNLHYLLAATISFSYAVTVNFFLNKHWTFQNKSQNHTRQYLCFFAVSIVGLLINLLIMYLLVEKLAIWYLLSKAIASIIVLFWNFLMNKYITFKKI